MDGGIGSAVLLKDQGKRCVNGLIADVLPVSFKVVFPGEGGFFVGVADENRTHAVAEFIAAGACKAGDGDRRIRADDPPDALGHGLCHRAGDGSQRVE